MEDSEFPSNSNNPRSEAKASEKKVDPERKVVRRVANGRVIQRKTPLYRKFFEAFRPEDGRGFVEYTLLEVLVPGIKDVIADAGSGALYAALGVDSVTRRRGRFSRDRDDRRHTSYSSMSTSRNVRDDHPTNRRDVERQVNVTDIILESRLEAEEVLDNMIELVSRYDAVSYRDLLSLLGERSNHTDEMWGWRDLRGSRISKVGGGWLLDLPRSEPLD